MAFTQWIRFLPLLCLLAMYNGISSSSFVHGRVLVEDDGDDASITCPPPDFDSVADFNLTRYISAPWYVQQQAGIIIQNFRNSGGVNRNPGGSSGAGGNGTCSEFEHLLAYPARPNSTNTTHASKLLVGPAPLAARGPAALGDYWVVAVGPSQNESLGYDWAIITAGPPNVTDDDGCRTGTQEQQRDPQSMNGVGLWLFSRKPKDPDNTKRMWEKAEDLGFDIDVLVPVEQEGCTYAGADTLCESFAAKTTQG